MKKNPLVQIVRIEVRIGNITVTIERNDVIRKMSGVTPETIRHHSVTIEGVEHPIKKAFARVTGVDVLDFNTSTARKAFTKLGFAVGRI